MIIISKQDIIDSNKMVIDDWNFNHFTVDQQPFCVDDNRLEKVLKIVQKVENIPSMNSSLNLIQKLSYFMGGISWAQPFCDGNKRTGLLLTATIFDDSGYEFEPHDEDELVELLYEIQEDRGELNQKTMNKIILYISKSVR